LGEHFLYLYGKITASMLKGTNKNHTKLFFHQVTCHKSVKNWCTLTSVCISTILRRPLTWLNQSHFTAGTISFIMQFFFLYRTISEMQLSLVPWEKLNIYIQYWCQCVTQLQTGPLYTFSHCQNLMIFRPAILVCVSVCQTSLWFI